MIIFCPSAAEDGAPDERTLHAGEPTSDGESKWIAQLWLHETSYKPSAPAGSSQAEAKPLVADLAAAHNLRQPAVLAAV